ncbi:MAG TPA: hypothetical protein PLE28_00735 [bacterium]|nr:hypothetical protein [bacterium]
MDFKDVTKDILDQNEYRLEQRFDELMRRNPHFKSLDKEDKEIVFDLIKKYKEKIRKRTYPSAFTIRRDMYHLYSNRVKMGLTYNDLDHIRDLLNSFKR